jgi:hypothetical protein
MGLMHNKALWVTLMSGASAVAISEALALLGDDDGLALDFTDDFHQADTGFYGSAAVVGGGTEDGYGTSPDTAASSLLTYTSPSVKMCMGPAGTLRFQAHNLYLNSASPANQSITVVSGATYAVTITGTVSVTASGAATGTWTAGTQTFTAATATLTFGSTSGAGTVHVRRTPSDSTYMATAGSSRFALPLEWSSAGVLQGLLVEEARTNYFAGSDSLSSFTQENGSISTGSSSPIQGVSFKTFTEDTSTGVHNLYGNITGPASGQPYTWSAIFSQGTRRYVTLGISTGVNGFYCAFDLQTGTAGTVTAIGAGTATSATITALGGGSYRCSITGSIASTSAFHVIAGATSLAPTVDAFGRESYTGTSATFNVVGAQAEQGSSPTSYIQTFGSTVTRAADNVQLSVSAFPAVQTAHTIFAQGRVLGASGTGHVTLTDNSGSIYSGLQILNASAGITVVNGGASQAAGTNANWSAGVSNKIAMRATANDFHFATNGTLWLFPDTSGTMPTTTQLSLTGLTGTFTAINGYLAKVVVLPRAMTNAELQTLTT